MKRLTREEAESATVETYIPCQNDKAFPIFVVRKLNALKREQRVLADQLYAKHQKRIDELVELHGGRIIRTLDKKFGEALGNKIYHRACVSRNKVRRKKEPLIEF